MNRNGNSEPANTGPVPLLANCDIAGASITGRAIRMPIASSAMGPTFMNVDRKSRGGETQGKGREDGDGNGQRDREDTPRTLGESVDDYKRQDREQDHHDDQHADDGGGTAEDAELVAGHLTQRAAAPANRDRQHQV